MKLFLLIVSIYFFIHPIIKAQQADSVKKTFPEIVVAATKTETPYYAVGSSVTLITSEDISHRKFQNVVEILREVPGLTLVQQGGPGKLSSVFIRGTNSNHALVIVDGVKMNDASTPNNGFDFSSLNTVDIERIEIVRGPQSTLYGSDAIAGVINIITKNGNGAPSYSLYGEGGSNNYLQGNISASGNYGLFHYAISASRIKTDGISSSDSKFGNSEKDKYSNNFFSSHLGFNFSNKLTLDLIYKYTNTNTDLDQSEKFGDDPNYTNNFEEHLLKSGLNISLLNGIWQQQLNASFIKLVGNSVDLIDKFHPNVSSDSYSRSQRIKFEWQNNLRLLDRNLITVGLESETEKANTNYFSTSDWGTYESIFPEQSLRTNSIFIQDQVSLFNSLFITAGFRVDDNQKFGNVITYRFSPSFYFNSTATQIKMSYGKGFKAPSLFNLFDPMFGNVELKPETSVGFDFGIEQNFDKNNFSFGITYFNLKLENMFGFDSNFRTINIAKASSKGIELSFALKDFHNFSFNFNYTFTDAKDEYEQSADFGQQLLRRPKHQSSFIVNYKLNPETNFNFSLNIVGERSDKDYSFFPAERVNLPGYTLTNILVSHSFTKNIELNARVSNLFDKQYEEVLYYGTLGRCFYFGVKFNF